MDDVVAVVVQVAKLEILSTSCLRQLSQISVDGLKDGILVQVLAAETVEKLAVAVLVVGRVSIRGDVVERLGRDPRVPVASEVGLRRNVVGPCSG